MHENIIVRIVFDEAEGMWKDPDNKEVLTYTNWGQHMDKNSSYNDFRYQNPFVNKKVNRAFMCSYDREENATWVAVDNLFHKRGRYVVCELAK